MRLIPVCLVATAIACSGGGERSRPDTVGVARQEVLARLAAYTAAARAVDAEASAAFFTARGVLFEPGIVPIVTPDSIRAFIRSFPGVQVDSAIAVADTVEVFDHSAIVWGSYHERLRFAGQPPSAQHGKFVMQWRREVDGVWRIERYYRVPMPDGWTPAPTNE